jgi:hypothetical protein
VRRRDAAGGFDGKYQRVCEGSAGISMNRTIHQFVRVSIYIAAVWAIFPAGTVFSQESPEAVTVPHIQRLASDGAWTWYNDPRTILDGNVLYIGSMDSAGVSRVDLYRPGAGDDLSARVAYPLSSWRSKDDHNNPALLKLADGRILAAYSKHHLENKWYWRVAEVLDRGKPSQRLQWGAEQSIDVPAKNTYCNLFQLSDEGGRIYNFTRTIGFKPNIQFSSDNAATWTGPFELMRFADSGTRPYVKYASNGKDRIDFFYTDAHPRDEKNNSVYHLYYRGGSFYKSDGTRIKTIEQLKRSPMVPSDGTRIYDGSAPSGRGWVWDLEYDSAGNPVGAFINSMDGDAGNDLRYRYARWDAGKKTWLQVQIAFAGPHIYVPENHYAGGISIDPDDVNRVYISTNVNPADGKPGMLGCYQIYEGKTADSGATWTWKQMTFDNDRDNLRPFVPGNHGHKTCVIWFRGRYNTYTDFQTEIVGVIEK